MAVHGYEATANGAICANGLFYDFPRRPFFSKVFIFSRVCFYVGMYIVCTFIQILGRDVVVFLIARNSSDPRIFFLTSSSSSS